MKTVKDLMDLKGKVAVIAGGAGHIGSSMADALAEVGASIVLVDSHKEKCEQVAQQIQKKYSNRVLPLTIDLSNDDSIRSVPGLVVKEFNRLDVLIHCAAFTGDSQLKGWSVPFAEQSVETWRKTMDVNLTSIFLLTQVCHPELVKSGHGSVISIASIYGMVGPDMSLYEGSSIKGHAAGYDAAKGGIIQLTRYFATVLAPVRANTISIGGVFRGHTDPFLSRYTNKTPLKRMATEEDLKGAAVYLASDLSKYVTGHNLVVDGGWTAV